MAGTVVIEPPAVSGMRRRASLLHFTMSQPATFWLRRTVAKSRATRISPCELTFRSLGGRGSRSHARTDDGGCCQPVRLWIERSESAGGLPSLTFRAKLRRWCLPSCAARHCWKRSCASRQLRRIALNTRENCTSCTSQRQTVPDPPRPCEAARQSRVKMELIHCR